MVATVTSSMTLLRRAVAAATLAPSVHNTQPWRFAISGDALDVVADRSRQLAVLDPSGRQLNLSLGCALFNTRVSLAASGVGVSVRRRPQPVRPDLIATVTISGEEPVAADLARLETAMRKRQTNRRQFSADPVPAELVERLVAAASAEGAILHVVRDEDDRQTLARLCQRADVMQISDAAYRAELRAWTTADPQRDDGVRAMVVPHVDGTAQDDIPIRDFDTAGSGWLPSHTRSAADQCLVLLGTMGERPDAWLRAGEALERVWLELTEAGCAASLFTQPIEVPAIRSEMRSELRLQMYPHLLMRIGYADVAPSTRRRGVEKVLDNP